MSYSNIKNEYNNLNKIIQNIIPSDLINIIKNYHHDDNSLYTEYSEQIIIEYKEYKNMKSSKFNTIVKTQIDIINTVGLHGNLDIIYQLVAKLSLQLFKQVYVYIKYSNKCLDNFVNIVLEKIEELNLSRIKNKNEFDIIKFLLKSLL